MNREHHGQNKLLVDGKIGLLILKLELNIVIFDGDQHVWISPFIHQILWWQVRRLQMRYIYIGKIMVFIQNRVLQRVSKPLCSAFVLEVFTCQWIHDCMMPVYLNIQSYIKNNNASFFLLCSMSLQDMSDYGFSQLPVPCSIKKCLTLYNPPLSPAYYLFTETY